MSRTRSSRTEYNAGTAEERLTARTLIRAATLALLLSGAGPVRAADPGAEQGTAVGAELDLLPTVLSAVDGQLGGGGNLWVGRDRLRLRAVGTHVEFPEGALTPSGFEDRRLTVAAGIVDVFLRPGFSGAWVGGGVEYWWNTIGSPAGPGTASWESWVLTLGGGYVWKIWGNLYLNPWAAGHLLLSRPEVTLYGARWKPSALTGEISLKIGWYVRL